MLKYAGFTMTAISFIAGSYAAAAVSQINSSTELTQALSYKLNNVVINTVCIDTDFGKRCTDYNLGSSGHQNRILHTAEGHEYSFNQNASAFSIHPIKIKLRTSPADLGISIDVLDLKDKVIDSMTGSCEQEPAKGDVVCTLANGRGRLAYGQAKGISSMTMLEEYLSRELNAEQLACAKTNVFLTTRSTLIDRYTGYEQKNEKVTGEQLSAPIKNLALSLKVKWGSWEDLSISEALAGRMIYSGEDLPTIRYRSKTDVVCANLLAEKLMAMIATDFNRKLPAVLVVPVQTYETNSLPRQPDDRKDFIQIQWDRSGIAW
ncbi:MAG: hypothetical protein EOP04_16195 [Proteobacteria bacterium]|nr:MAG: hypothetical protein EOP04_16195 [Pseudomonadota bacterium]